MDTANFVGLYEDYDGKYRRQREKKLKKKIIDESTIIPKRERGARETGRESRGQGTDLLFK